MCSQKVVLLLLLAAGQFLTPSTGLTKRNSSPQKDVKNQELIERQGLSQLQQNNNIRSKKPTNTEPNSKQHFPQQRQQIPPQNQGIPQNIQTQQFAQQNIQAQQFSQQNIQPQQFSQQNIQAQPFAQQNTQPQQFSQQNIQPQQFAQQNIQEQRFVQQGQLSSTRHPSQLLNQLTEQQKQVFIGNFGLLKPDQQIYAYNKFLTAPPEVQQFAIQQFLSLDPNVLVVSIEEELKKQISRGIPSEQFRPQNQIQIATQQFASTPQQIGNQQLNQPTFSAGGQQQQSQFPNQFGQQQFGQQRFRQKQFAPQQQSVQPDKQHRFSPQPQQQFEQNSLTPLTAATNQRTPNQTNQPSRADVLALQKQQEQLQEIIRLQESINFPRRQNK